MNIPAFTAAILIGIGGLAHAATVYQGRISENKKAILPFLFCSAAGLVADSWVASCFFRYPKYMVPEFTRAFWTLLGIGALLYVASVVAGSLQTSVRRMSYAFLSLGLSYATLAIISPHTDVTALRAGVISMVAFALTFAIVAGRMFWLAVEFFRCKEQENSPQN